MRGADLRGARGREDEAEGVLGRWRAQGVGEAGGTFCGAPRGAMKFGRGREAGKGQRWLPGGGFPDFGRDPECSLTSSRLEEIPIPPHI